VSVGTRRAGAALGGVRPPQRGVGDTGAALESPQVMSGPLRGPPDPLRGGASAAAAWLQAAAR